MWEEVDPSTGALDPENKMVFAVGSLVGTRCINSNRMIITTKSPQSYPEMTINLAIKDTNIISGSYFLTI